MQERSDSYERMPFFKLYSREWLQGSLRIENDAAERGVWTDFLALANESRNRGVIQANDETPYPHTYLAQILNIPLELLEHCIEKFTAQKRIQENDTGILIINFAYWQGLNTRRRGRPSKTSRYDTEFDLIQAKKQNVFGLVSLEMRKKGKAPGGSVAAQLREDIDRLCKQGKTESEIVKEILHRYDEAAEQQTKK